MPKSGPIKRHGGKSYLAPKIRALMPKHTRYCEPFFGGGAVLLAGYGEGVAEFVNDIDRELTNFWRMLRDQPQFGKLQQLLDATPFSKIQFEDVKKACHDWFNGDLPDDFACNITRAWWFFIVNRQSRQGLGRDFATPTSRLRRGMNEQVSAWLSAVEGLPEFHARLKRVEIRCGDAKDFIKDLDSPDTCFYCDPPYVHSTRSSTGEYEHEMDEDAHKDFLTCITNINGKALVSGYRCELYDYRLCPNIGWRRVDFEIPNQASSKREKEIKTECVWMNY